MNSRQLTVLFVLGALWGASFLFIKIIIDEGAHPLGLAAARCALGAVALAPVAYLLRDRFPHRRSAWLVLIGLGFLNFALPWTLFATAAQHAPSAVSSIANSSQPLWAAIFASALIPTERINRTKGLGLLLGFAGVLVLMAPDLASSGSGDAGAIVEMLFATMCYGISVVVIRRWLPEVHPIPLAFMQLVLGAVFLIPTAGAAGALPTPDLGSKAISCLLVLGLVNSGMGVLGYMWLVQQVGAVRAVVVTYLIPPTGIVLGWAVLGESIGWNLLLGVACIIAGVVLVQQLRGGAVLRRIARTSAEATTPAAAE